MAKGINIEIGVDPKKAVDGVETVDDALAKVADTLDDLGKGGDKDIAKVEKSLKELDKESVRTGEAMKKNVGQKTKAATDEASEGVSNLKDEALQSARETAASFDGSAQSIVDMFQEVSANAFIGFGAAGTAAGLAAAAGLGLVSSVIQTLEEDAQKSKAKVGELVGVLIESGQIDVSHIGQAMKDIATGANDGSKSMKEIKEQADKLGVPFEELVAIYADDISKLDEQIAKIRETEKAAKDRFLAENAGASSAQSEAEALGAEYENQIGQLEKVKENIDAAKEAEALWLQAGGQAILDRAAEIETLNSAYDDAAGSILDYLDKETGVIDTAGYIQAMKDKEKALLDYQTALAGSGFTDDQKRALDEMGYDSASAFMTAYKKGTAAQKKDLEAILTKTASDSSGAAKDVVDKTFAKPTDAVVRTTVDPKSVEAAKTAIQNGIDKGTYKIKIEAFTKDGKKVN